jgi:hypothetical protein
MGHDVVARFLKQNLVGPNLPRLHNGLYKQKSIITTTRNWAQKQRMRYYYFTSQLSVHPLFIVTHTHTKTFGFHDTTVLMGWEFMPFELWLWYIIEAAFCPHNNIRLTKVFVSSGKKAWGNFLAQENIEHS